MADVAAQPRQPHGRPFYHALQLPGAERQVCRHHNNTAALVLLLFRRAFQMRRDFGADAFPADAQILQPAVVCKRQHAQGITRAVQLHNAAGAADAAFQAVAHHAFARAHIAFLKIGPRVFNGRKHMFLPHRAAGNVVQPTVVALCHHRVHTAQRRAALGTAPHHIFHHCVVHQTDIQCVRQCDGCFQRAQLADLHQSRSFAEAVEHTGHGGQLLGKHVVRTGHHHRHTRFLRLCIDGAVAHRHTPYIGDLSQRPAGQGPH